MSLNSLSYACDVPTQRHARACPSFSSQSACIENNVYTPDHAIAARRFAHARALSVLLHCLRETMQFIVIARDVTVDVL